MFKNGFLVIGRYRGAPIRVHWTLPLGAFVFGRFAFVPGFWLAFALLILLHELGHAMVVVLCKQHVLAIDVQGFGGLCTWDGAVTPMQRVAIAWGGVLAQTAVLVVSYVVLRLLGPPTTSFGADLASAFIFTNMWLIALNLLPVPPLDGVEAWRIVPLLRARYAKRGAARVAAKPSEKGLRSERVRRAGSRFRVIEGGGGADDESKGKGGGS